MRNDANGAQVSVDRALRARVNLPLWDGWVNQRLEVRSQHVHTGLVRLTHTANRVKITAASENACGSSRRTSMPLIS